MTEVWFEIFRVGVHNGEEYTVDSLDLLMRNFRPPDPDVPCFIGHNTFWGEVEKPALGWVDKMRINGEALEVTLREMQPELEDAIRRKTYPKRSVEMFLNYRGRGLTLTGVAFLGSSIPAVGGMPDIELRRTHAARPGRVVFDYDAEMKVVTCAAGTAGGDNNEEGGEETMDPKEIQKMIDTALAAATPGIIAQFKGSDEYKSLLEKAQKADDAQTQVEKMKSDVEAEKCAADLKACEQFADKLLQEKRITPAMHKGLGRALHALCATDKVKFADGVEKTVREYFQELFAGLLDASKLFEAAADEAVEEDNADEDDLNGPVKFSLVKPAAAKK